MVTKRDDYIRHIHECRTKAEHAATPEISSLWETIEQSYRFLAEREDRLARECTADGINVAVSVGLEALMSYRR